MITLQIKKKNKIYFAGDFHLGKPDKDSSLSRETNKSAIFNIERLCDLSFIEKRYFSDLGLSSSPLNPITNLLPNDFAFCKYLI